MVSDCRQGSVIDLTLTRSGLIPGLEFQGCQSLYQKSSQRQGENKCCVRRLSERQSRVETFYTYKSTQLDNTLVMQVWKFKRSRRQGTERHEFWM